MHAQNEQGQDEAPSTQTGGDGATVLPADTSAETSADGATQSAPALIDDISADDASGETVSLTLSPDGEPLITGPTQILWLGAVTIMVVMAGVFFLMMRGRAARARRAAQEADRDYWQPAGSETDIDFEDAEISAAMASGAPALDDDDRDTPDFETQFDDADHAAPDPAPKKRRFGGFFSKDTKDRHAPVADDAGDGRHGYDASAAIEEEATISIERPGPTIDQYDDYHAAPYEAPYDAHATAHSAYDDRSDYQDDRAREHARAELARMEEQARIERAQRQAEEEAMRRRAAEAAARAAEEKRARVEEEFRRRAEAQNQQIADERAALARDRARLEGEAVRHQSRKDPGAMTDERHLIDTIERTVSDRLDRIENRLADRLARFTAPHGSASLADGSQERYGLYGHDHAENGPPLPAGDGAKNSIDAETLRQTLADMEAAFDAQSDAIIARSSDMLDDFSARIEARFEEIMTTVHAANNHEPSENPPATAADLHALARTLNDRQAEVDRVLTDLAARLETIREETARHTTSLQAMPGAMDTGGSHDLSGALAGISPSIQLGDIVKNTLPPNAYKLNARLENNRRADCLITLPGAGGPVPIDATFPIDAYTDFQRDLRRARVTGDVMDEAENQLRHALLRHIVDLAEGLTNHGKSASGGASDGRDPATGIALMFVPSETIFADIHARFPDVVADGFNARVWLVSPTSLMATLHAMQAAARHVENSTGHHAQSAQSASAEMATKSAVNGHSPAGPVKSAAKETSAKHNGSPSPATSTGTPARPVQTPTTPRPGASRFPRPLSMSWRDDDASEAGAHWLETPVKTPTTGQSRGQTSDIEKGDL